MEIYLDKFWLINIQKSFNEFSYLLAQSLFTHHNVLYFCSFKKSEF